MNILNSIYLILTLPNVCAFYIKAANYKYCYDTNVTDKTYNTECLIHFESIRSSCNVKHNHTNDQTYAVEK
jgi:hypothetical protein